MVHTNFKQYWIEQRINSCSVLGDFERVALGLCSSPRFRRVQDLSMIGLSKGGGRTDIYASSDVKPVE